jgi:hypothetical protein
MNETTPVLSTSNGVRGNDANDARSNDVTPKDQQQRFGNVEIVIDDVDKTSIGNVETASDLSVDTASNRSVDKASNSVHALFYIESTVFNPSEISVGNETGDDVKTVDTDDSKVDTDISKVDTDASKVDTFNSVVVDSVTKNAPVDPTVEICPKSNKNRFSNVRQKVERAFEHLSVEHYSLPPQPKWQHRLKQSLLLPPHGPAGKFFTLVSDVMKLFSLSLAKR